jgi:iron complex outermembrane receptor protein
MKHVVARLLAGASLAVITGTAAAPAQAQGAPSASSETTLGEIVVTARRRSESLQEVPQTVNAVTADTLQKLNIRKFEDVQAVVPGLSLSSAGNGFQFAATMRGVNFDVTTGAAPTVALYMNDAPVQSAFLFQSLFDVGQIEVLKGPQGTTRGISAPSGAITLTTHKPDLSDFGGYADVTLTDLQGRNVNAAVNAPIIKDVLGVRIAGVMDQNTYDGVRSLHNDLRPDARTQALRASLSFEPSDVFNANVTYQHLERRLLHFEQVSGPGPGAFTLGGDAFPATVNPPLTPKMRASVSDGAIDSKIFTDVVVAQADSRLFGQHLSYIGSYQRQRFHDESSAMGAGDAGNILPGVEMFQTSATRQVETTHEFRLASDPAPGRFFDYTVGAFYDWRQSSGLVVNPGPLLPGAFGLTPTPSLAAYNPAYQVPIFIDVGTSSQETSLFGSLTLHLGANTELTGGVRHIWSIVTSNIGGSTGEGLLNLGAIGLPSSLPCSVLGARSGPGVGDCLLPPTPINSPPSRASDTPNIYNVSLSHHFTRDLLVYANTGTAYRPSTGTARGTYQGDFATSLDPRLQSILEHPAERSRAYEVGIKSTWLDGRARLNASIFRQRFSNLIILVPNIQYLNTLSGLPATANPTTDVDALIQGFDIDAALQVTPQWSISAQASYADGKVQGSRVPCNLTDPAGNPVFNTAGLISLCPGGSTSRQPLWNATFQSEYVQPIANTTDGFLRILASYYPQNKNRVEPNLTVPSYSQVALYLGARSHDGAWEASIFARNAFNTQRTLDLSPVQENLNTSLGTTFPQFIHDSGYYQTLVTPRREVGVHLQYAWGSR